MQRAGLTHNLGVLSDGATDLAARRARSSAPMPARMRQPLPAVRAKRADPAVRPHPSEGAAGAATWDFAHVPASPPGRRMATGWLPSTAMSVPPVIQPKLKVGAIDDPLEHEADRVADRVMRMTGPVPSLSDAPPALHRKCAACAADDRETLRRAGGTAGPPTLWAPPIVHETLSAAGRPLDDATRAFFEPRFGADFSRVRVHTDAAAASSAEAIGALAYTAGPHVAFAAGRYAPSTHDGRRLMAHELAHVAQGGGADPATVRRVHRDPATGRKAFDCPAFAGDTKLEACLND